MPNSISSPLTSSTTLTCHSESGRGVSNSSNSSSMRLPSMEELLRKTGRLSERNRTLGHVNFPSTNIEMSSQGFVDLTSDSSTSSFNLPSFQHFPNTSFTTTTPISDSPYSSFLDMPPRISRGSRDPPITRDRPNKRRRGNDSIDVDEFLNFQPSSSYSTSHQETYKADPIDILDLTSPSRKNARDKGTNGASTQRKVGETLTAQLQEEILQVEPPNEQDKQLADTIKAQSDQSQSTPRLNQLTCIICMDDMVNMTATICGHLFCHKCITDALRHGENQADGRSAAKCPMCRTKLRRKVPKGNAEIVPLSLKLMKRSDKSKGKQKEVL